MLGAMPAPRTEQGGNVRIHVVQPGVIESVYSGYLTSAIAEEALPAFLALLAGAATSHWIMNAAALEGFEKGVLIAGRPWIHAFKEHGGQGLILVTKSASTRMAGSALGFAMGITLKVAPTRAEALALLPAG
jgi:hypothetical protein